jgi:hypothetical protein
MGSRQTRAQRQRQRANDDEGDEDAGDGDYEDAQEREARERNAQNPPSSRLGQKMAEEMSKWNQQSLTERYGFYFSASGAGSDRYDQIFRTQLLHWFLPHGP